MLDDLIEIVLEIIFEFCFEKAKFRPVSRRMHILLLAVVLLTVLGLLCLLLWEGVFHQNRPLFAAGCVLLGVIALVVCSKTKSCLQNTRPQKNIVM